MGRSGIRRRVTEAATATLDDGEQLLGVGFAWLVDRRPRVPLLVLARRPHWLAVTDRRLLVYTPARKRALRDSDLVLARDLARLELIAQRRARPMLQVELAATNDRRLIVEVRPRDRALGTALAASLGSASPSEPEPPDDA